jgi:hypothetical protein
MDAEPLPRVAEKLGNDAIRYHRSTDTLLVADAGEIVTVYERQDDRRSDIWTMVDHYDGGGR